MNIEELDKIRESFAGLANTMANYQLPEIYDSSIMSNVLNKNIFEEIESIKNPLVNLAEEQIEHLKTIIEVNQGVLKHNKELVSLNEKILNKINSLDNTLEFLSGAFNKNASETKESNQQQVALLLELITIMEDRDECKLKTFMENVGAPVGAGLLVEYFKLKFGLAQN